MRIPLLLICTLGSASAAVITVSDSASNIIPDGNSSGLVRTLAVMAEPLERVVSAEVNVTISVGNDETAFLGDLYLYLSNGTHLSVLANRPGRRAGASAGYGDNESMNVTFSTTGAADIHNYRLTLNGGHALPISGALTGIWQADGRAVDPAVSLDTSPRTAGLDVFAGDDAAGSWHLFVADVSSGNVHALNGWTLRLNTLVVPEPGSAALLLTALAAVSRRRRKA